MATGCPVRATFDPLSEPFLRVFLTRRRSAPRPPGERLVDDPELIPGAVDEILRFDPSVPVWRRVTKRPVTLGGVELPEGAKLFPWLAAAGRDADAVPLGSGLSCHTAGRPGVEWVMTHSAPTSTTAPSRDGARTPQTSGQTPGGMLEEVMDLSVGAVVVMLPLLLLALPGIALFVVLPAILLLAVVAPMALLGAVLAGPPYLVARWLRRHPRAPARPPARIGGPLRV